MFFKILFIFIKIRAFDQNLRLSTPVGDGNSVVEISIKKRRDSRKIDWVELDNFVPIASDSSIHFREYLKIKNKTDRLKFIYQKLSNEKPSPYYGELRVNNLRTIFTMACPLAFYIIDSTKSFMNYHKKKLTPALINFLIKKYKNSEDVCLNFCPFDVLHTISFGEFQRNYKFSQLEKIYNNIVHKILFDANKNLLHKYKNDIEDIISFLDDHIYAKKIFDQKINSILEIAFLLFLGTLLSHIMYL
jgi:hypothetical protein